MEAIEPEKQQKHIARITPKLLQHRTQNMSQIRLKSPFGLMPPLFVVKLLRNIKKISIAKPSDSKIVANPLRFTLYPALRPFRFESGSWMKTRSEITLKGIKKGAENDTKRN